MFWFKKSVQNQQILSQIHSWENSVSSDFGFKSVPTNYGSITLFALVDESTIHFTLGDNSGSQEPVFDKFKSLKIYQGAMIV